MDCVFCKIITGELPSEFVYKDDYVVAFKDLNPQASTHILLVPRAHISDFFDESFYGDDLRAMREHIWQAIPRVLEAAGIDESKGFRLIQNNGEVIGQSVLHLHFHLLSGKGLNETLV